MTAATVEELLAQARGALDLAELHVDETRRAAVTAVLAAQQAGAGAASMGMKDAAAVAKEIGKAAKELMR